MFNSSFSTTDYSEIGAGTVAVQVPDPDSLKNSGNL